MGGRNSDAQTGRSPSGYSGRASDRDPTQPLDPRMPVLVRRQSTYRQCGRTEASTAADDGLSTVVVAPADRYDAWRDVATGRQRRGDHGRHTCRTAGAVRGRAAL